MAGIELDIIDSKSINTLLFSGLRRCFDKLSPEIIRKIFPTRKYLTESKFHESIIKEDPNVTLYLDGYWQSPKYQLKPIIEEFKLALQKTISDNQHNQSNLIEKIINGNSVSIHVRRGDQATKKSQRIYGIMNMDYFERAIKYMENKVVEPISYFVFSDDLNWCKENFKVIAKNRNIFFCDFGSITKDFFYMSKCKHCIISNSTFSWWSSFINDSPDRVVIAPKNWYTTSRFSTSELIPKNWILL